MIENFKKININSSVFSFKVYALNLRLDFFSKFHFKKQIEVIDKLFSLPLLNN